MLFPDQSPVVLIAVVISLLAIGLIAAGRDLLHLRGDTTSTCPACGQAFNPQRWTRRNERALYHGRYTVTPLYICPKCGETVQTASS